MADKMGHLRRTHYAGELREENIGEEVILMGWVQGERSFGSIVFVDIRDVSGISQVVFDQENDKETFDKAKHLRSEDVIAIKGIVRARSAINEDIPTGKIEIEGKELKVLDKSDVPPIYVKDGDNVSENMRLQYRTLDLRKPSMQQNLITRAKIYKVFRDYLSENRFIEVETPILGKPTPEGARDYLVPSRVNPGKFYSLPQSPQLFKQMLMVSGLDRYFQIAKCFRDEDLRANRQPEFTQVDIEMSFVDVEDVLSMNEGLIQRLFKEILNVDIELPLKRLSYDEAMERYGIDKPDTRFGYELIDVSEILQNSGFKVFSGAIDNGGSVRLINIDGKADEFSRKDIDKLENFAKTYGAKGLAWMKITDEGVNSPVAKFLEDTEIEKILEKSKGKVGDLLLLVADKNEVVFDALGNLRNHIADKFGLRKDDEYDILWVTDFPLFEYDEEENRYVAKHHPFTSPRDEDLELLETEPEKVKAKAYDIVMNGDEMGGGSIRISNSDLQRRMFNALGIDEKSQVDKFGFLLDSFKYGVPPHGGIAYGLDRLVMLFVGTNNIRNVIAFPKTQSATDLLTGAPIELDDEQLLETHIKVIREEN
ncbi:MAG: aspartate--tRNA ligase [Tissierellia bacterium]|nr:aspartate--tRNA ligase [Tissierellia bacterium]